MPNAAISFQTEPSRYRHWRLDIRPPVATLTLAVDPAGGLDPACELKLNSYDLSVDIELNDAVQRLRFEHPEVRAVVVTGGLDKVFCAGANIQMLSVASHEHKVNFCKFTNETRNAIEDATCNSDQIWIAAINGTAAGGGYELALACDEILLVDDKSSAVSLPEVPLLGVLPGTGGLTRLVDKRHVRRDLADAFSTAAEGVRGETAKTWGLVDDVAPPSTFAGLVEERAARRAVSSQRPADTPGVVLTPLDREVEPDIVRYGHVEVRLDRGASTATFVVTGPRATEPTTASELLVAGASSWLLRTVRELDDAILHLRFNEPLLGTWVFRTVGDGSRVADAEAVLIHEPDDWLAREVRLYWARTLERLDLSARTLVTLVEPGSCFVGVLAELVLAADRSFMLDGTWTERDDPPSPATIRLTASNLDLFPMTNELTRLRSRFWKRDAIYDAAVALVGKDLEASDAASAGLVTFTPDDLDWDDEVRLMLEERASYSPDALTGLEANVRFVGPETMRTKIFARLSAWQNWIFQRPNAVGPDGALHRYGTGTRPDFDKRRV